MVEISVTVMYEGMSYLTNVITDRNTSDEEILRLAYEQVRKQWEK
ncbi:BA3454 family stress response protein [Bacillus sp. BRMEA1]|nr:BA3454 family stress response protein [Neobacillus endophyticus]NRD80379.1 BA3454 family stress response protein [Neobacillus endophyticus]